MSSKTDSKQRRSSANPKSSRQQFSACGACRMRRVRCDLKDLQAANPSSGLSTCSNCQERGLRCVDEFAEVKAVKLLRRGRRLQQVEAVYGKSANDDDRTYPSPSPVAGLPQANCIPRIRPEFLTSRFFQALLTQYPIIEPLEFTTRFYEAQNGNDGALGIFGQLLCLVLSVWAVSFGVDEAGEPNQDAGPHAVRQRKERVNVILAELLHLIDTHGVLRKPSWDGVRILFLVLPLTEEVLSPLERGVMQETAINHTYALCNLSANTVNSGQGEYVDSTVRARIFWYAYIHEGITTGLRGGRLLLSDDDLAVFQSSLPPVATTHLYPHSVHYTFAHEYSKIPLRVSGLCRQVHCVLTGPASRRIGELELVPSRLHEIWGALRQAWDDLESLRQLRTGDFMKPEEAERFVNGWQIVIFECFNAIQETLKQRLHDNAKSVDPSVAPSGNLQQSNYATTLSRLHALAEERCQHFARLVTTIVRRQLRTTLFQYDASFVRDGCFYAALWLSLDPGSEDEVNACLYALRDMRWGFCKSDVREQALHTARDQRRGRVLKDVSNRDAILAQNPTMFCNSSLSERVRNPPPPLMIMPTSAVLPDSAPNTALTEDGSWASGPSSFGTTSHRSSSGSPPFAEQHMQKNIPLDSTLMLTQVGELGAHAQAIYYESGIADMDTFAYSINSIVPPSTSPLRSPHSFSPPHSGMSSSSVPTMQDAGATYRSVFDPAAFNGSVSVSPPGSARSTADAVNGAFVVRDKDIKTSYHVGYNHNGHLFV